MPFVDREGELRFLNDRAASGRAELLVVYGRRRVGKTELLKQFCADKRHVFFVSSQTTSEQMLKEFSTVLSALPGSPLPSGAIFADWPEALRALAGLAGAQRFVAVLDEFPYLLQASPAVASQLQNLWDHELKRSKLMLILCGSQISVMEAEVLGHRSPLYGRRTGQWHLTPLSFRDAGAFFPRHTPEERLQSYGVLGGMPAYLEQFDPRKSLAANVVEHVLSRGTLLYEEVQFLLLEELRDASRYYAALTALAAGATQHQEVARAIFGPAGGSAQPYLNRLRALHLVDRVVPASVRNPERTRTAIYRITDPFVAFWFRFAVPNLSALEQGAASRVWEQRIRPAFAEYMGQVFEDVARAHTWLLAKARTLPFEPDNVAPWWDGREEIDVVAARHNTREAFLAECTWSASPLHPRVLDDLQRKAAYFQTRTGYAPRGLALYARRDFSAALRQKARALGATLYNVEALFAD